MNFAKMYVLVISSAMIFIWGVSGAFGQDMKSHEQSMKTHMNGEIFLVKKDIDDYTVSFHVMKVKPDIKIEGTHNFMVKIEKQDKVIENAIVNSKIIFPSGRSESKFLDRMGNWYMKPYTFDEQGEYQLIVLFKTPDGEKHTGGVYYDHKTDQTHE